VLTRGSTLEMVLDRPISFTEGELNFGNYQPPHPSAAATPEAANPANHSPIPTTRRRDP